MKIAISSKELEVLRKSVDGLTVSEIAEVLQLKDKDIVLHQKSVLKKTQSDSPLKALQTIAKLGFILVEEPR